jgi:hypothetical protein
LRTRRRPLDAATRSKDQTPKCPAAARAGRCPAVPAARGHQGAPTARLTEILMHIRRPPDALRQPPNALRPDNNQVVSSGNTHSCHIGYNATLSARENGVDMRHKLSALLGDWLPPVPRDANSLLIALACDWWPRRRFTDSKRRRRRIERSPISVTAARPQAVVTQSTIVGNAVM